MIQNTTISDSELVNRCKDGDENAFSALYNRHAKAVYNSIYRIVGHEGESEDILQESFVSAFQQLGKFENSSLFGAWVKRIGINKAISNLRKNKVSFLELKETYQPESEEQIDEFEFEFKVEEVKKAIVQLPRGYRTIVTLHLIEDIPQEEIGKILGISHVTVRSQYHRAKNTILKYLKHSNNE